METNFFDQIAALKVSGNISINIQSLEDGNMAVSVLLTNKEVKDKAAGKIPSMLLKGPVKELNEKFFVSITAPIQKTNQLFCNMLEHEKAIDSAKGNSKMQNDQNNSAKKDKENKRKKFDEQMKKVDELEKLKKYGEAIGQVPDAKLYPEFATEIKNKMQQLRGKHGSLSLFGEEETLPSSTGNERHETYEENNDNDDNDNNDENDVDNDDDEPPFNPDEENEENNNDNT